MPNTLEEYQKAVQATKDLHSKLMREQTLTKERDYTRVLAKYFDYVNQYGFDEREADFFDGLSARRQDIYQTRRQREQALLAQ